MLMNNLKIQNKYKKMYKQKNNKKKIKNKMNNKKWINNFQKILKKKTI